MGEKTVCDGAGVGPGPNLGGSVDTDEGATVVVGNVGPRTCNGWIRNGPWFFRGIGFPGVWLSCLTSLGYGFRGFGVRVGCGKRCWSTGWKSGSWPSWRKTCGGLVTAGAFSSTRTGTGVCRSEKNGSSRVLGMSKAESSY